MFLELFIVVFCVTVFTKASGNVLNFTLQSIEVKIGSLNFKSTCYNNVGFLINLRTSMFTSKDTWSMNSFQDVIIADMCFSVPVRIYDRSINLPRINCSGVIKWNYDSKKYAPGVEEGERKVKTQRLGGRLPPFMASAKGIVGRILTAALWLWNPILLFNEWNVTPYSKKLTARISP